MRIKRFFGILRFFIIVMLSLGLTAIAGCGYATRSVISQLYKTIYVRPFLNKIDITKETSVARRYQVYQPLLENDITREVINEFILDGSLRLAKEEDADLILEGELVDYRKDALSYKGEDDKDVEEYRISIVVNLKLHDISKQTILWEVGSFVGDTTYLTQASESSAIAEAVNDLARRIIDGVTDIW